MAQSIKGKIAYITGAARGIGKATTLELAREGVHVGLIARTGSTLEQVAEEARSLGVKASVAVADISDMEQVEKAISKLKNELGSADILINNAGIGTYGSFMEIDPADWKENL